MIQLASDQIAIQIAPEIGGRITSFIDVASGYEFLWRNAALPLRREAPGAEYDPNFYGGIDELLPNDKLESVCGVELYDHGELWTSEFSAHQVHSAKVAMKTFLLRFEFEIEREVSVEGHRCIVRNVITNHGKSTKPFMWKLHAAVTIEPGDVIECPAKTYTVGDPAYSSRTGSGPWKGEVVPEFNDTIEFLFIHELHEGWMAWRRGGKRFQVDFDLKAFPYAWYFASYGGFLGHRMAILEPCTCMPMSVNEAYALGQCSVLEPGESLQTEYSFRGTVE
jgi:hypothetical protein